MPGMVACRGFHEVGSPKNGDAVCICCIWGSWLVGQSQSWWVAMLLKVLAAKNRLGYWKPSLGSMKLSISRKSKTWMQPWRDISLRELTFTLKMWVAKMLDAVLHNMRLRGRIVVCGMNSKYNLGKYEGVCSLFTLVAREYECKDLWWLNFTIFTLSTSRQSFQHIKASDPSYVEDIAEGLEGPFHFDRSFFSCNVGKQVVVANEWGLFSNLMVLTPIIHVNEHAWCQY